MNARDSALQQQMAQLYHDHQSWLSAFLQRRLGCSHSAADLVQDTYLRLLSKGKLPEPAHSRGYLTRIAKGLLIDLYRRRRIEQAYLDELAAQPEHTHPSPEHCSEILEALVTIDRLLHGLPVNVRRALLMRRLDGMSYRAIAEELGVSISSVEKYIARALQSCLQAAQELER
ncbi:RNA polymerase sigma factor [Halopseudomonas oceani]|jgi:RNA polymerase sigma-70 factor (ECF subfamily)|uniref:RNA polymerase subunit sigma n=1 Tax=Halopseudomonas oceani TaxID=1708783 RepID=A0A2P4ESS1_9GAMM|nr:sigma-70 family RNA polymerase sigma factor [Halopseudomonas oceani]POB02176.1 RNA polymerase subunit sigma [Halopseudomonas oceani]GGE53014.1 RNA polymerase sigma factor [Halopseudomonas oceani]